MHLFTVQQMCMVERRCRPDGLVTRQPYCTRAAGHKKEPKHGEKSSQYAGDIATHFYNRVCNSVDNTVFLHKIIVVQWCWWYGACNCVTVAET